MSELNYDSHANEAEMYTKPESNGRKTAGANAFLETESIGKLMGNIRFPVLYRCSLRRSITL